MYAVVQIGSRIARFECGTTRSTDPCASAEDEATSAKMARAARATSGRSGFMTDLRKACRCMPATLAEIVARVTDESPLAGARPALTHCPRFTTAARGTPFAASSVLARSQRRAGARSGVRAPPGTRRRARRRAGRRGTSTSAWRYCGRRDSAARRRAAPAARRARPRRASSGADVDVGVEAQQRVVGAERVVERAAVGEPEVRRAAAGHRRRREAAHRVRPARLSSS